METWTTTTTTTSIACFALSSNSPFWDVLLIVIGCKYFTEFLFSASICLYCELFVQIEWIIALHFARYNWLPASSSSSYCSAGIVSNIYVH
jgi:hypothetical protein